MHSYVVGKKKIQRTFILSSLCLLHTILRRYLVLDKAWIKGRNSVEQTLDTGDAENITKLEGKKGHSIEN